MKPYRVYIAAASTPDEMLRVERCARALAEVGIEITSTWPTVIGQVGATNPRNASVGDRRAWSAQDLSEVANADALWLLCPPSGAATRGAWCEMGYAWAKGRLVIASGDTKQTIFTALGAEYDTDDEALHALALVAERRFAP